MLIDKVAELSGRPSKWSEKTLTTSFTRDAPWPQYWLRMLNPSSPSGVSLTSSSMPLYIATMLAVSWDPRYRIYASDSASRAIELATMSQESLLVWVRLGSRDMARTLAGGSDDSIGLAECSWSQKFSLEKFHSFDDSSDVSLSPSYALTEFVAAVRSLNKIKR